MSEYQLRSEKIPRQLVAFSTTRPPTPWRGRSISHHTRAASRPRRHMLDRPFRSSRRPWGAPSDGVTSHHGASPVRRRHGGCTWLGPTGWRSAGFGGPGWSCRADVGPCGHRCGAVLTGVRTLEVGALTALVAAVARCDAGGVRRAGAVGATATATSAGYALVRRSES